MTLLFDFMGLRGTGDSTLILLAAGIETTRNGYDPIMCQAGDPQTFVVPMSDVHAEVCQQPSPELYGTCAPLKGQGFRCRYLFVQGKSVILATQGYR